MDTNLDHANAAERRTAGPLALYHLTNMGSAINIIRTGEFVTHSGTGDQFLNCFVDGRRYNQDQEFEGRDAILWLRWTGGEMAGNNNELIVPPVPVLIDCPGHRAIIAPAENLPLEITSLVADDVVWERCVGAAPWYCFTRAMKRKWIAQKTVELKAEISERVKTMGPMPVRLPSCKWKLVPP
jgi:hypothetical protein